MRGREWWGEQFLVHFGRFSSPPCAGPRPPPSVAHFEHVWALRGRPRPPWRSFKTFSGPAGSKFNVLESLGNKHVFFTPNPSPLG